MAVVDDRDQGFDPLEVLGILRHVRPRRHELRDERHPLLELRVLLEEEVESAEPAEHVLGQVRAVDAQDQVVSPPGEQLLLELLRAL